MFGAGYRTPNKASKPMDPGTHNPVSPRSTTGTEAGPSKPLVETEGLAKVRKSIGDWEMGKPGTSSTPPDVKTAPKKTTLSATATLLGTDPAKPLGRVAEAKACLMKAKMQINSSRNLKAEIKTEVINAVERLFRLVKEAEAGNPPTPSPAVQPVTPAVTTNPNKEVTEALELHGSLIKKNLEATTRILEELKELGQHHLLKENTEAVKSLNSALEQQRESIEKTSYASVAASVPKTRTKGQTTLHSIVVSSEDVLDTGEEVLRKIREAVEAKEGWVKVENVRKAKDSKIIMGCDTKEERDKVKEKITKAGKRLVVEDMKNRDPLLVLKSVLSMHSDEEVVRALRNQNRELFHGLNNEENRVEIKFRKKTRNPHTCHIVITASPIIWRRATDQGRLRIDLQNVFVDDQSPLVQCSKCLGYGHGRRFCKAAAELCSHCGGTHLSPDCPDRVLGEAPRCVNCTRAGNDKAAHNAFSMECPVRRKWDGIARASIQYC